MSALSTCASSVSAPSSAASTRSKSPRSWPPSPTTTSRRCGTPTGSARISCAWKPCSTSTASTRRTCRSTLMTAQKLSDDIKANAEQGSRAHRPRGGGPLGAAAREDAGAARRHPARDRRPEAEAQGRRGHDRSDHPDAAQHARVRPRAGSARPRRQQHPASPAAPHGRRPTAANAHDQRRKVVGADASRPYNRRA